MGAPLLGTSPWSDHDPCSPPARQPAEQRPFDGEYRAEEPAEWTLRLARAVSEAPRIHDFFNTTQADRGALGPHRG
ncbi:MAG: hypothetical protein M3Q65_18875, partial [Chloroflexota bacterium]|nr:hypothetical protein [Chloroflexota bacterium]